MIEKFEDIVSLFLINNVSFLELKEEQDTVKFVSRADKLVYPDCEALIEKLEFINHRDILHFSFVHEGESLCNYRCENLYDYDSFTEDLFRSSQGRTSFELIITIEKVVVENKLSVYFVDSFVDYLKGLSFLDYLHVFKNLLSHSSYFFFEILNKENVFEFATKSIYFNTSDVVVEDISRLRSERNEKVKNICHSNITSLHRFVPEDFYPIRFSDNKDLNNLFTKVSTLYSLIYLYDIFNVIDNFVDFKLNGYKSILKQIPVSEICSDSYDIYFRIYEWVYSGGGINDKIGLARNIVSLSINSDNLFIEENVFHSIQSGYKIYQKENIKQYIEIRNKISDQLLEIQKDADKIVDDFITDFRKSLFTFVSFFASVIVIKVLAKGDLSEGFSPQITFLSVGFLAITVCIMLFRIREIKKQIVRYETFYKNLKERYADLLNENDIVRILNNDKDFFENIKYIRARKRNVILLWSITIIILFVVVLILASPLSLNFSEVTICNLIKVIIKCFITNI